MWNLKITIFGILVMVFCTGLHGQRAAKGFAEDYLDDALLLMFEEGIPKYYSGVSLKDINESLDKGKHNTLFYYTPIRDIYLGRPNEVLSFWMSDTGKSKKTNNVIGLHYDVNCYLRDIQEDNVVEYWVIHRFTPKDEPRFDKCRFIITVADTINSSRRIVVESDNFIDSVEVCGRTIRFPKDNLYFLASLEAWNWPKSYENSDLDDYIVKFKNGEPYSLKELNWFQKSRLRRGGWLHAVVF
jgi:hypothetical protein